MLDKHQPIGIAPYLKPNKLYVRFETKNLDYLYITSFIIYDNNINLLNNIIHKNHTQIAVVEKKLL